MSGPKELLAALVRWAEATPWCDWVELAGSLARNAGDEASDIDAGLGVRLDGASYLSRRDETLAAARGFAVVADELIQHLGSDEKPADHLVIQYADGRQLSLVVMPADDRPGLPPAAEALLDRSGQLSRPYAPPGLTASAEQLREWAFLAWWGLADVAKHAGRGKVWRAIESLHEVRTYAWRLYAAEAGLDYPVHGVVAVQNAGLPGPSGIEATQPSRPEPPPIITAARALADALDPLTRQHEIDGVRAEARRRLLGGGATRAHRTSPRP